MNELTFERYLVDAPNCLVVLPRGGEYFPHEFTRVDDETLKQAQSCALRWPEENSTAIESLSRSIHEAPSLTHWLACETAWFVDLPRCAAEYALPQTLTAKGYRCYGGDGLLHHWASQQLSRYPNLVSLHLGDAPSLAAIHQGKAVDCSQGYSAVEGLPSAHSCGSLDPSIPLLLAENGYTPDQIGEIFSRKSGWGEGIHLLELLSKPAPGQEMIRRHVTDAIVKALGEAFAALGTEDTALALLLDEPTPNTDWIKRLCERFAFAGFRCGDAAAERDGWTRHSAQESAHAVLSHCIDRAAVLRELWKNR